MYFVVQVVSKTERKMMDRIRQNVDNSLIKDIFVPSRERMRKENGKWITYSEVCFPGYIFIETKKPNEINRQLRVIEGFSKVVSFGNNGHFYYIPLSEEEERVIDSLIGKDKCIELSQVKIEEGKEIKVVDGPLIGLTGKVIKYNLHKRTALVELDLGGIKNELQLGIDIIRDE